MSAQPVLDVQNVTRLFKKQPALSNVSFTVNAGEIVTIIGRSGAGKSTLLRCLCGLERPDEGKVVLHGRDLTQLSAKALERERRKIGLVFQHFNLLNNCTVADNIALPLKINKRPAKERAPRIEEMLELVGLKGYGDKYPSQLSGGQKQRVGIARALAAEPDLLLCDEATSALDPEATQSILKLLSEINRKLGVTIILITHEMDLVQKLGKRILVLDHGHLIADRGLLELSASHDPALKLFIDELRVSPPEDLTRILGEKSETNRDLIIRAWFDNDRAENRYLLNDLGHKFAVKVALIRGGVAPVEDKNVGDAILRLSGAEIERAYEHLKTIAIDVEELGYVPHDC